MTSKQTPSRRSFLFDPVATDLISFDADGCNSTGYSPLGDPLLSFTGRDPFFGAPYGDASRLNEDQSASQASNGLYQLFETHALTGPSPALSPLAGLSPSAARLTAQTAAFSPSYRGHSGVGGNALTDPSWLRAQRVDDVVREPARLTDNVAAFTDDRWPETRVGDASDGRGPPCSAVDPFASRSDAHVGEQACAPVTAAPASEQSLLHATAAQLLNVLLEAVRSQPCALKGDRESPQPSVTSSLRVPLPEYSSYSDRISATEYLEALHHYQQATRLTDSVMLGSVLPVSLTAQAARWYRLVGHQARSMEEFRALFRSEFLPPEYERRMRRHSGGASLSPPPSASLEPRCAWAGRDSSHWGSPNHEAASDARDRDAFDVSDRALDPYSYARAATVARQREQERKPRAPVHEGISDRGAPTAASERTPRSSEGSPKSPPVGGKGVVCFRCRERGHTACECNAPQPTQGPPRPSGNGVSRRDGPFGALRPFAAPTVVSAASKSPDATRKKEERRPNVAPAARVSPSDAKTGPLAGAAENGPCVQLSLKHNAAAVNEVSAMPAHSGGASRDDQRPKIETMGARRLCLPECGVYRKGTGFAARQASGNHENSC
ncbi:hypothetical protein HPB51_029618 [Rhipicephalus microplus]|uniref:CCHC-type domain-containing protein n=1 Tax=Rhipicephalus microplus TaxID=6941 RepID=A0A9J6CTW1_RHIMP|nr:hypothetical protein HPB51_029618 [Rhipicephalus microplus]